MEGESLFDGHDADYDSTRLTVEAHIERMNEEDRALNCVA
jgi:hypothetical protein